MNEISDMEFFNLRQLVEGKTCDHAIARKLAKSKKYVTIKRGKPIPTPAGVEYVNKRLSAKTK